MKKKIKQKGQKGQKGGEWNYNEGGTGISDLPADIFGVIVWTVNSLVSAIDTVGDAISLPGDMGKAFDENSAAPRPDNI